MHCCSCQMQNCFNKWLIENCTHLSYVFALGIGVVDHSITGDKACCKCRLTSFGQSLKWQNTSCLMSSQILKVLPDFVNYPTEMWMHSVEMLRKNKSPKWRANKSTVCQRIVFISSVLESASYPYWHTVNYETVLAGMQTYTSNSCPVPCTLASSAPP